MELGTGDFYTPHPPPPPSYNALFGSPPIFKRSQVQRLVHQSAAQLDQRFYNIFQGTGTVVCRSCNMPLRTKVVYEPTCGTHCCALLCSLCLCWLCCWMPYCMESCKRPKVVCVHCDEIV